MLHVNVAACIKSCTCILVYIHIVVTTNVSLFLENIFLKCKIYDFMYLLKELSNEDNKSGFKLIVLGESRI
jgi:hypothetical protein